MMRAEGMLLWLLVLGTVAMCSGCVATLPQRDLPPAFLLEGCPEPESEVSTNAELAAWVLALRHALKKCDNDKAALRDWAQEIE